MKKHILFDLDGTLTNPSEGITNSVRYAFEKLDKPVPCMAELELFIGPPLNESFEQYGMDEKTIEAAIVLFREYFKNKGIHENILFDGCHEMLAVLKESGAELYVATSKPEVFANSILQRFDLAKYFTHIVGSPFDGAGTHKPEIIASVLDRSNFAPENAIMVGDRKYDILGAKEHGITPVGVLFGFGSEKELEAAGAEYIAKDFEELENILINKIN